MNNDQIIYKTKTATEEQLYTNLVECKNYFYPPLDERVNIGDYSKKLFDKSITFEAWVDNKLIGFLASYLNFEKKFAFFSNACVIKEYMGLGIGTELFKMAIQYAMNSKLNEIILETHKYNVAIRLYERLNFRQCDTNNDMITMKLILESELIR